MIEISHLTKVFQTKKGHFTALDDVSLTIPTGSIYGVIGLSGAGKSTLIRCINLLEQPTGGDIRINGDSIVGYEGAELIKLRRKMGMIFQSFNLLAQKNVYANIAYPLEIAKTPKPEIERRVNELLEMVGLSDKVHSYPSQLSGGQQQRVAIARAMAGYPEILLCDEPTSALDIITTRSILSLLKEINEKTGITIVIITHEMSVVRQICDHVAVIDGSHIAEEGETDSLLSNPKAEISRLLLGEN